VLSPKCKLGSSSSPSLWTPPPVEWGGYFKLNFFVVVFRTATLYRLFLAWQPHAPPPMGVPPAGWGFGPTHTSPLTVYWNTCPHLFVLKPVCVFYSAPRWNVCGASVEGPRRFPFKYCV